MRIAMMGSGGVGGYFGGRMAASGCDVTFIARGRHLAYAPLPGREPDFHQPDAFPSAALEAWAATVAEDDP